MSIPTGHISPIIEELALLQQVFKYMYHSVKNMKRENMKRENRLVTPP